jgi:hypothetical protein
MTLSQQERRQLELQDAHFLARPLSLGPEPFSMAAHVRQMVRLFQGTRSGSPSAAAMAHLTGLYERNVAPRTDIACRKGCGHCCSQPVLLSAPEAFWVAEQLRRRPDQATAMADAVRRLDAIAPDRLWQDWVRCPLLEEESCSIYTARPLACHGFVSVRLEACLTAFVDRGTPDIPMPQDRVTLLHGCRMILYVAQRLIGVRDVAYEMNHVVTAILDTPDAEARWLGGEDILAGLEDKTPIPPQYEREIAGMTAFVAPTL